MKEGWTYKKLGSLCKITTGKRDANHAKVDGKYRFYTCANQYLFCDTYTFDGNCLILPGNGANVGEVYKYSGKFDAYQRTYVLCNFTKDILFDFLYYVFRYKWKSVGTAQQYGSATNYIVMSNFTNFIIGYPTLPEQERIVSELDLLSSIIEKKKAQLKEYDQLAQSIFYDMFGDPFENPKGWEISSFGCIMTPAKSNKCQSHSELPILSITMHGGIVRQEDRFKKVIASKDVTGYKIIKRGQLVIAFPIDEGLIYTQDIEDEGIMSPAYNVWDVDYKKVSTLFLKFHLHSPSIMKYYKDKLRGTTLRRRMIPKEDLLNLPIPLPPLTFQQFFASKIEAIERQKALIQQSITEVETLFNSRMDYWFS